MYWHFNTSTHLFFKLSKVYFLCCHYASWLRQSLPIMPIILWWVQLRLPEVWCRTKFQEGSGWGWGSYELKTWKPAEIRNARAVSRALCKVSSRSRVEECAIAHECALFNFIPPTPRLRRWYDGNATTPRFPMLITTGNYGIISSINHWWGWKMQTMNDVLLRILKLPPFKTFKFSAFLVALHDFLPISHGL